MKKLPRAEIHLVRLDGTADTALTATGQHCLAPAFAPAGKPRVAFMDQEPGADRLCVVAPGKKEEVAFELNGLRAFVWDISGASLYALCLAGRSRGRVVVCELKSGKQLEATVVASVDEASLATNTEKNTVWLAAKNPETRIAGLFKMKSTGNNGPWSLVLRMPGPWSSLAVHPVSGVVHGLLHLEDTLQLVNEGKPRSPLEIYFRGVHTKQPHRQQIALSPDGATLAFLHNGEIHVVAAPGTEVRKLTGGKGECGPPAWHPDGKLIAYVRNGEICLLNVTTGKSQVIPGAVAADDRVAFSPDGQTIAYSRAME
jgi:WD40 repeat protein